ncbi:MAG: prepilin peptidase [Armatimonadota bacterium]
MTFDFWTAYWTFTSFVFGAIVGSFLNVCILRLPRGESPWGPPSHCPQCQHRLRVLPDMVPILSQLWYRSRCRYCGSPFSWRYLWIELLTGLAFVAVYLRYGVFGNEMLSEEARGWSAAATMLYVAALIAIFFIDLEHYEIPDIAVLAAFVCAFARDVMLIMANQRPLWQTIPGTEWKIPLPLSIFWGLVAFWMLWQFATLMTAMLGREAMGAGDSLLLGAMGAFLIPWPLLVLAFLAAVALGTVGGLIGMGFAARDEQRAEAAPPAADPLAAAESPPGGPVAAEQAQTSATEPEHAAAGPISERASRGAAGIPSGDAETPAVPELPPSSRWGRLWTVAGTWLAVFGLWGAAVQARHSLPLGLALGLGAVLAAAALIYFGARQWVAGDREWLPAMDELFEGDPGPRFIPFGPYLVAGTFLAMMFGRAVVEWYAQSQLGIPPQELAGMGWY